MPPTSPAAALPTPAKIAGTSIVGTIAIRTGNRLGEILGAGSPMPVGAANDYAAAMTRRAKTHHQNSGRRPKDEGATRG
jgi:hypothetical protein